MKKIPTSLLVVIVVAALLGIIMSGAIIKSPKKNTKIQVVTPFPTTFPDVSNDSTYKAWLNTSAVDPTQSVRVGGSQNASPFSGAQ
jgi:hypothetical protein